MKRLLATVAAPIAWVMLTAGSCATVGAEPKIETKIVEVPVTAPCKPALGPDPVYPDTDEALAGVTDVFEGTKLLKAGRTLRIARLSELATALKGCEGAQ